jgi:predicted porin
MNKSLLALAVLASFAGVAAAQSSVTIYGKLDQAVGKRVGTDNKQVMDNAGSRLGFKGVEDLGGGMKALFGMEHRFTPENGAAGGTNGGAAPFWGGYSTVGLAGAFGMVNLGRQYTPSFLMIQNQIDPWAGETVADLRDVGMRFGPAGVGFGQGASNGETTVRVANSVRYDLSMNGFNFGASIGESTDGDTKPVSAAANYAAGPLFIGAGYELTKKDTKQWNVGARYNFGVATATAGLTKGDHIVAGSSVSNTAYLVGVIVPVGAMDLKAGYAQNKDDSAGTYKKAAVGIRYNLSKRTYLFTDYTKVGGNAVGPKTGYDFGMQHNF